MLGTSEVVLQAVVSSQDSVMLPRQRSIVSLQCLQLAFCLFPPAVSLLTLPAHTVPNVSTVA